MNNIELVAYEGAFYTVEWYYDYQLRSQSLDYYRALPTQERTNLLKLFKRIGDVGRIYDITKFRNEGDKIYAFKPSEKRFLCFFFKNRKIVVTNAFDKKKRKLPKIEKIRAITCYNDYIDRLQKGNYYV